MRSDRREIRRNENVAVGDLIQYRFTRTRVGSQPSHDLATRRVIEVIDNGAAFRCEGGYRVSATQINAHIPMHENS